MFEAFCQTQLLVLRPLKLTLPKLKMMDYRITKSTTLLPRISSTSFKRVGSFRLIGKLFHPCCFLVGCYVFFMIHNLPPQIKRPQETGTKVSTFFAFFFFVSRVLWSTQEQKTMHLNLQMFPWSFDPTQSSGRRWGGKVPIMLTRSCWESVPPTWWWRWYIHLINYRLRSIWLHVYFGSSQAKK